MRVINICIVIYIYVPYIFLFVTRHVHGFLEEIGQGVQHIASRVDDLPAFVQRANDYREITGEVGNVLKNSENNA